MGAVNLIIPFPLEGFNCNDDSRLQPKELPLKKDFLTQREWIVRFNYYLNRVPEHRAYDKEMIDCNF